MQSKLVRPLPKGQITIPVAMRRALGIDENSVLQIGLEDDRIVISKLELGPAAGNRLYSDQEIEELLEEDRIKPETAQYVRELVDRGLL